MPSLKIENKLKYKSPLDQKTDKEKVVIYCSDCEKPLINILPSSSDKDITTTFVVECGFCSGKSYETVVQGLLSISPCNYVILIDTPIDTEKNIVRILTQKVSYKHD